MTVSVAARGGRRGHYGPSDVLRSEWTKLRSVRSTTWALVALVVLTIAIGLIATKEVALHWAQMSAIDRATFDPTSQSLSGLILGQIAIGVLGALVVTAEHATGSIRATFAAVPNRPLVLAAKGVVFGVVALVVGEVAAFVAFFLGQAMLTGGVPSASIGQAGVLRAVAFAGAYVALIGLVGLGLGAIIRHTAGAIGAFVGIVLVLPLIIQAFQSSIRHAVAKYLPAALGASMASVRQQAHTFSPGVSIAIMCAYAAAALLIGGWLLVRRDA